MAVCIGLAVSKEGVEGQSGVAWCAKVNDNGVL
jgi:hypothetical protein